MTDMTDREKAIDKIKKLLRMKRGGTVDEIATALDLAQKIAAEHGINIDDVNPDDEGPKAEQPLGHADPLKETSRIQCECKFAALVCEHFFNVSVFVRVTGYRKVFPRVVRNNAMTFVGTAWDLEISQYVYHFLIRQFRFAWAHKSGRARNREAFMYGFYQGLCAKLRRQKREAQGEQPVDSTALVRLERGVERRKAYIGAHFGEMTSSSVAPDHDADAAYTAGWMAGRETEIRGGIKSNQDERRLLA